MPIFRPPTSEQLQQQERLQQKSAAQEALISANKQYALYQKQHQQWQIVLRNLFERLLQHQPRPIADIRLGVESPAKEAVLQIAADLVLQRHGPLNENRLNDPEYLYLLATILINVMVTNHYLNHHPDHQHLLKKSAAELLDLTEQIKILAEKTSNFQEKDLLQRLAHFLLTLDPSSIQDKHVQTQIKSFLDEMAPETLENIQHCFNEFFKKMDDLANGFSKEIPLKDIDRIVDKQLTAFKLPKPQYSSRKIEPEEEGANLLAPSSSDNPYCNLVGLAANLTGTIPITISNNLGNGLGLLNSLRPTVASSSANIDSWHEAKEMTAGIEQGLFNQQEAESFYENVLKRALQRSDQSSLPSPFNNKPGDF